MRSLGILLGLAGLLLSFAPINATEMMRDRLEKPVVGVCRNEPDTSTPAKNCIEVALDKRAIQLCKDEHSTPTSFKNCMAVTQVAFVTLDAITKQFGPKVRPILTKCSETNNKHIVDIASCAIEEMKEAVNLKHKLPSDAKLHKELQRTMADEKKLEAVYAAKSKVEAEFANATNWDGDYIVIGKRIPKP